jgi:hypothetical protein
MLMWLAGRLTQGTDSFSRPFYGVGAMAIPAAVAGWAASRREVEGQAGAGR